MNLPTREILATPHGLLLDLIACNQVWGGAKPKQEFDEDPFPDLL